MCACVSACVRARACVCMYVYMFIYIYMLSISFSRLSQKPRQATGEDSAEAEPTEAKPSGQPLKPSADRKSSEERTERPRKQSGLPLEYAQPPEPTVDIDPRPQVFQDMREAKFKQQEARAQAEQLVSGPFLAN